MFFKRHPRRFEHTFIYVDEKKDKINDIRQKALDVVTNKTGKYRASDLHGFLTEHKFKKRISTSTALISILICIVIWYFLMH